MLGRRREGRGEKAQRLNLLVGELLAGYTKEYMILNTEGRKEMRG